MKIKTRKELWLKSILVMLLSIFIGGCIDENIEVIGECPVVISTDPANSTDRNVPLSQVVNATFNTDMDPTTLTADSFRLMGSAAVAGSFSFDEGTRTLSFESNEPLEENTNYTATVFRTVKDVTGNLMQEDFVWTFNTVLLPVPTIELTTPRNMETNVALNQVITADFSEAMQASTITETSFLVSLNDNPVAGNVTYTGLRASFTPDSPLLAGNTYSATITTAATSMLDKSLASNFLWSFTTIPVVIPPVEASSIDLGEAEEFGILAGVGISNNAGFSEIRNLSVGISPGVRSSITGFPPAIVINGFIHASDDPLPTGIAARLVQAKQDLTDAYLFLEGASSPAPVTVSGDQGGLTLAPGIYKSTSTLLIQAGDLTLDAQGNPDAVFIFQIASDFTTVGGAGGNVILTGGAQAKNVYWQTGSSATIGDNTSFQGNVLALTSITMNSGATAVGRMLARNGSVVLTNTNIIERP
ncbi:ice-binding family protein [Belliella aquatica]|nr:ice-binding family protein [Belliella aquatica]MCH7407238.1 ice-binding family protein [Belliella aquatica]